MSQNSNKATAFTAWSAILGGLFAYANVALVLMVTGGDTEMILDGTRMLSLPEQARDLFRWGMFADILGFYLPVLIIGAYLWHRFRDSAGMLGDVAVLAIALYVVVGVGGAAVQLAALHPLAQLHAGGGEVARAAAEAAWTAVAHASQKGLWWSEGPVVLFWGMVVGNQLRQAGWGKPVLLLLKVTGWCFGLFFLFGMFPALNGLMKAMLIIVVLIFPLWMLLFGRQLLRRPV
jgi:hypothetical protein